MHSSSSRVSQKTKTLPIRFDFPSADFITIWSYIPEESNSLQWSETSWNMFVVYKIIYIDYIVFWFFL